MHGKAPTNRFFHSFSKAGFGHASLLQKQNPVSPCLPTLLLWANN